MKHYLIALALSLVAISAIADTKFRCVGNKGDTAYSRGSFSDYDHNRYGVSPIDLRFQFAGFVSSFDSADDDNKDGQPDLRGVPEWVAYEMKRIETSEPVISPERPSPWYEMAELAFLADQQGVTTPRINKSYTGYGQTTGPDALNGKPINRGHLAMKSHIQRLSWKAACNTHVFANAVPQQADMNQGDWLALEAYSGAAANHYGRIWIIAGPVWKDGEPLGWMKNDGTIPVAVPAGLFKIIIKENGDKHPDVMAFVFDQPKSGYVMCSQAKRLGHVYKLAAYLTSVTAIEELTGLEFLRNISFKNRAERDAFKKNKATSLWPVEKEDYTVTCG